MEVIIVDDNSPDGTQERVKDLQNIYGSDKIVAAFRAGKLGLGSAYIHGLERCKYDYVVLMDADLSHHVSENNSDKASNPFFWFLSPSSSQSSLTRCMRLESTS